jgi:glycogen(starch) synthase
MSPRPTISRLLMTTDTIGGVWTYALELCRALPEIQIVLATMGPRATKTQRAQIEQLEHVLLIEGGHALEWMDDPWLEVENAGQWLLDLESLHCPDLIHLNGYVHASLPWQAPVLVVAHSCVVSWWHAVRRCSPPPSYDRYRHEVSKGLACADAVVAPSEAMLRSIALHYGPPRQGSVIRNAVDPSMVRRAIRKEPIILCAGRLWDDGKNASALTHIAANLPWPVFLAGDAGAEPPSIQNVTFLGHCNFPTMAQWFGRAAIYALPARYEPFGLSALEAAHAGAALVLGDIPSLREIWDDSAWFVDPDDPLALENALRNLIHHPELRETFGRRARERATQYQIARFRDDYLSLYSSLIQSHHQQPIAIT